MPVNKWKDTISSGRKGMMSFPERSRHLVVLVSSLFFLLVSACIESFNPDIEEYESLLAVDGSIIKGDSVQTV